MLHELSAMTDTRAQPLSDAELDEVRAWLDDMCANPEPECVAGRPMSRLLATIDADRKELAALRDTIERLTEVTALDAAAEVLDGFEYNEGTISAYTVRHSRPNVREAIRAAVKAATAESERGK